jgi:hypothetical protein
MSSSSSLHAVVSFGTLRHCKSETDEIASVDRESAPADAAARIANGDVRTVSDSTTARSNGDAYCDICRFVVRESEVTNHVRTIVHNFAQSVLSPSERLFVLEASKGYQLLRDIGWNGKSGLGATESGRLHPVATTLRVDRRGVGSARGAFKPRITHFPGEELEQSRPRTAAAAIAAAVASDAAQKRKDASNVTRGERKRRKRAESARCKKLTRSVYADDDFDALLRGTHPSQRDLR